MRSKLHHSNFLSHTHKFSTYHGSNSGARTTSGTHTENKNFLPLPCIYWYTLPRIPLIEDLTTGPIPPGSSLLVEFDPRSQWYNASLTIAAGWLKTGGTVTYVAFMQPVDEILAQLTRLGIEVEQHEKNEKLRIMDYYSATLGKKPKEKYAAGPLKVADLSITLSRDVMRGPPAPNTLRIMDNTSALARFNEEKSWVEYLLTRGIAASYMRKWTSIRAIIKGVHSDWAYKQLEAAHHGVIDFKLEESGEETRNLLRISNMRNLGFNSKWHPLKINENFEVTQEK